jgi:hypothetical protein
MYRDSGDSGALRMVAHSDNSNDSCEILLMKACLYTEPYQSPDTKIMCQNVRSRVVMILENE